MSTEERERRYQVRKIKNLKESELVSSWDSYQFAKGEADRLFRTTEVFHFVIDTWEEAEQ